LKLAVKLLPNTTTKEEHFLYLTRLNETRRDTTLANETHKKCVKAQYDKFFIPCVFFEGDLVLLYDQNRKIYGEGKFRSM
jgi:hypothetical protein